MVAQQTRDYELVTVLNPESTEDEVAATLERVGASIKDPGGEVANHDIWGVRPLAFPVMKFTEGNFVLMHFASDPSDIKELNRSLKASEDIIRFLVTKVESPKKVESAKKKAS